MTKLIIDADTGSDDAVALLMAYRNLPEDKIRLVPATRYEPNI